VGKSSGTSGIWVLLILILLVVLGIVFRDKLRRGWFRMKSKFGKGKPPRPSGSRGLGRHRPLPLPTRPRRPLNRVPERRILPPQKSRPSKTVPRRTSKSQKELDAVLKKLKEMSK